ncbi:MAG: exodeoxyribonuclease VII large subunit [Acidiferrobacterales bacterium]|nr:exodeoxyribonuclease VII large subunit [Acidiferrobacterales bacterium]
MSPPITRNSLFDFRIESDSMCPPPSAANNIFTVKSLVGELKNLLESNYRHIVVEGEISGLARPASGHLYFSLKEGNALIRCAFFRNRRMGSSDPEEGMQALIRGQISVYESRGDLQLIVTRLEPAGQGALQRAFELLKKKLHVEGLFDLVHKQPIPEIPSSIGIVTSTSGAALQDIRVTLKRRFPVANVIVYPTLVQGDQAVSSICHAIKIANLRNETEVLIIARGGGSLEDLHAFNDEKVARAIFQSALPVVCGVGHETDFTIADMVSDDRAATPTAAAERVTPDGTKILRDCIHQQRRLVDLILRLLDQRRQTIDYANARLVHPTQRLARYRSDQINLKKNLVASMRLLLLQLSSQIQARTLSVSARNPLQLLKQHRHKILMNRKSIMRQMGFAVKSCGMELARRRSQLILVSPMQTLERGYVILQDKNGHVLSHAQQIPKQKRITATLQDGKVEMDLGAISFVEPSFDKNQDH